MLLPPIIIIFVSFDKIIGFILPIINFINLDFKITYHLLISNI